MEVRGVETVCFNYSFAARLKLFESSKEVVEY